MRIERIEIQNFRGFYGDHEIDLSVDDKKSVTLIIAENGVGKSTILNSIFWCFYGDLTENTDLKEDVVHDDAKKCVVSLTIIDNQLSTPQRYVLRRFLDKGSKQSVFKAFVIDDIGNSKPHLSPQELVNHYLPKALANYFLFYGEGLKSVFTNPEELKRAIEDFQGLTAASKSKQNIIDIKDKYVRKDKSSGKKTNDIKINEKAFDKEKKNYDDALKKEKECTENAAKENEKFKEIDDKYKKSNSKELKELNERRKTLEGKESKLKSDIKSAEIKRIHELDHYSLSVLNFPNSKKISDWIKTSNTQDGVPGKYHKMYIETLLNNKECICSTKLVEGEHHYECVKAKLAEADSTELRERAKLVHGTIHNIEKSNIRFKEAYEEIEDTIADLRDELDKTRVNLEDTNNKITRLGDANELDIEELESQRKKYETARDNFLIKAGTWKNIKDLSKNKQDQLTKELLKLKSSTFSDEVKIKLNFLQKAEDEITELIEVEKKKAKDFIFSDMNNSLNELSAGNHEFRFEKDTWMPRIIKTDGKTLKLSDGEKLLKQSLFFATALIKHSNRRVHAKSTKSIPGTVAPIVADAPFGFLDGENNEIAAKLLLDSSDQLIIMLNSKSFEGDVERVIKSEKKKLGKVFLMEKLYSGKLNKNNLKPVKIFGEVHNTAFYDNKIESTRIKEIKIK